MMILPKNDTTIENLEKRVVTIENLYFAMAKEMDITNAELEQRLKAVDNTLTNIIQFTQSLKNNTKHGKIINDLKKNERFGDMMAIHLICDILKAGEPAHINEKPLFNKKNDPIKVAKLMPDYKKEKLIEEFMINYD